MTLQVPPDRRPLPVTDPPTDPPGRRLRTPRRAPWSAPRDAGKAVFDSAGILRTVGRPLLAKAAILPVTAVAALASAHTVVGALGISGYALFALVIALPGMVPIGDLGAGAALTDAVARNAGSADKDPIRRTLLSGGHALSRAAGLIMALGAAPAALGMWSPLLGEPEGSGADAAVGVASVLFACTLPLSLGRSLLAALNRSHMALLLQGAASVLSLSLVLLAAVLHLPPAVFVASSLAAQCAWGVGCLLLAGRFLGMPLLRILLTSMRPAQAGVRIGPLAAPMAVITAASAIAYSTDRLVLSHMSGPTAVVVYSAGAQLFAPASGLVTAAGLPLWAVFARQRQAGHTAADRRQLVRLTACFAVGGQTIGLGLVLVGPVVGSWIIHGHAHVGAGLMLAFGALLFVQAVDYPASMWLTDAPGLRFQAIRAVIMTAVNLALSIPLARLLGAPGPVIGSCAAYAVTVAVPTVRKALSDG